ncbi:MAG: endolytic transglycosylase MltG, partial [Desulfobulbus sp.]|nr:endolytic transglycosylase MltG [Desulfobulbus sp.]
MRYLLIALFLAILVSLVGVGQWYRSYLVTPASGQGEVVIDIPKGAGVRGIGALLAAHGILSNDIRYLAMVHFSGLKTKLKAGEYSIPLGMTPPQVLELLASGRTLRHHVTIPEGLTAAQIAAVFEQDGWVKQDRFLGLVKDGAFIRQLGIEADSLEGYLFPETYT